MKNDGKVLILFFLLVFVSSEMRSQEVTKEDIVVTGYCSPEDLKARPECSGWFVPGYAGYEPEAQVMQELKTLSHGSYTFAIVLGTWCSDSREQVPRFFKIFDAAGFIAADLSMICVSKDKKAEGIDLSGLGIVKVPTFIIYLDDVEIGRIVETPAATIEQDMLTIFRNQKQ